MEQAWFRGVKVERATVRTTLTPLGRVCSALPGSTVDGTDAPHARPTRPAPASGAPSIPESERPRRRHVLTVTVLHGDRPTTRPIHAWAGVGGGSAERAEGRSAGAARAGSAPGGAERSRALMK